MHTSVKISKFLWCSGGLGPDHPYTPSNELISCLGGRHEKFGVKINVAGWKFRRKSQAFASVGGFPLLNPLFGQNIHIFHIYSCHNIRSFRENVFSRIFSKDFHFLKFQSIFLNKYPNFRALAHNSIIRLRLWKIGPRNFSSTRLTRKILHSLLN